MIFKIMMSIAAIGFFGMCCSTSSEKFFSFFRLVSLLGLGGTVLTMIWGDPS